MPNSTSTLEDLRCVDIPSLHMSPKTSQRVQGKGEDRPPQHTSPTPPPAEPTQMPLFFLRWGPLRSHFLKRLQGREKPSGEGNQTLLAGDSTMSPPPHDIDSLVQGLARGGSLGVVSPHCVLIWKAVELGIMWRRSTRTVSRTGLFSKEVQGGETSRERWTEPCTPAGRTDVSCDLAEMFPTARMGLERHHPPPPPHLSMGRLSQQPREVSVWMPGRSPDEQRLHLSSMS